MQVAQAAQERMIPGFERYAGIASAAWLLIVAPLQIGAGAKRARRTGHDKAAYFVAAVVNGVERLTKAAQHVHGDRVHDFRVVELQDRQRAVEIERDMFELHRFPRCWPAFSAAVQGVSILQPYLIFKAALSMVRVGRASA